MVTNTTHQQDRYARLLALIFGSTPATAHQTTAGGE